VTPILIAEGGEICEKMRGKWNEERWLIKYKIRLRYMFSRKKV
jgi:hypothetical protein